jgi:hypothetical protein
VKKCMTLLDIFHKPSLRDRYFVRDSLTGIFQKIHPDRTYIELFVNCGDRHRARNDSHISTKGE